MTGAIPPSYTIFRAAPPNRRGLHTGEQEEHFPEGCVMLAYAMHLLATGARDVEVRPDGMQGKRFDFRAWLENQGFVLAPAGGRVPYVGAYSRHGQTVRVACKPGDGDVIALIEGRSVIAECKGGIINTRHPGQLSHLRKGLLEGVGQLLCRPQTDARHVVVVPRAAETLKWAGRIAHRARDAGIEIALISRDGEVHYSPSTPLSHRVSDAQRPPFCA